MRALLIMALVIGCSKSRTDPQTPSTPASKAPAMPYSVKTPPVAPPGAEARTADLSAALQRALGAKAADYAPRTHHLHPDGSPKFVNRLIRETSPYLLQHAHNPVDWYAWGDDAFAAAQALDRPILLSIGYSTCHWCHVMERESFEDAEIAAYINRNFIAIKVDREERPDVDSVYMHAARMLSGGNGGWPMTIVMTPSKAPFFGGTYFPARTGDRGSRKGFFEILQELKGRYAADKQAVVAEAAQNTRRLQQMARPPRPAGVPRPDILPAVVRFYAERFDPRWGGFGRRPKFPRPVTPQLLLRYHRRTGDPKALSMVTTTLRKMHAGGMYDHVGGGFHRYSVDTRWHVPHFEKMLYDNAQLAVLYAEAWQITGDAEFEAVVRETLDYVLRDMTDEQGGFYSATDADSARPDGHMEEGWCFTWTPAEIDATLDDAADARAVKAWFKIDPRGDLDGRNVLNTPRTERQVAAQLGIDVEALRAAIARTRPILLAAREKRPQPLKDTKVIAAWNGMMIHAFAYAGMVFDEPRYRTAAAKAADFILQRMRTEGRLMRTWKDGQARHAAVMDDYAFVIEGLLTLFEATGEGRWISEARALQARQDEDFADSAGGWFLTAEAGDLLAREKPAYDGARATGNSTGALNLLRLAEFTSEHGYRVAAEKTLSAFARPMSRASMPKMLAALDYALDAPREVVIVAPDRASAKGLRDALRRTFLPNRVVIPLIGGGVDAQVVPLVEAKVAMDGKATAYVCEAGRCERPTSDPKVFAEQLSKVHPLLPDRSPAPL